MNAGMFQPLAVLPPRQSVAAALPASPRLFPSATHAAAVTSVVTAVRMDRACTLLTGAAGLGKTAVLEAAIAMLAAAPQPWALLKIRHPAPPPLELQRLIGAAFGIAEADRLTPDALARCLAEGAGRGQRVVLLIDDAQLLPQACLLYLRLILDVLSARPPRLQLVLAGRPPLLTLLAHADLAGGGFAGAAHAELQPLTPAEMSGYVAHRLAGGGSSLRERLTRGALAALVAEAAGVPRRADALLLRAPQRDADGDLLRITRRRLLRLAAQGRAGLRRRRLGWPGGVAAGVAVAVMVVLAGWQNVAPRPVAPRLVVAEARPAAPVVAEREDTDPAVAAPAAVKPAVAVRTLPGATAVARSVAPAAAAPLRVALLYNRHAAKAKVRAEHLATALRAAGVAVGGVVAVDRHADTLAVRYFDAAAGDAVAALGRRLTALLGRDATVTLTRREPAPAAGTVDVLVP